MNLFLVLCQSSSQKYESISGTLSIILNMRIAATHLIEWRASEQTPKGSAHSQTDHLAPESRNKKRFAELRDEISDPFQARLDLVGLGKDHEHSRPRSGKDLFNESKWVVKASQELGVKNLAILP